MVDGDGDDVVGWYDINYIYRRMTLRFVDYDEVEVGKIKQNLLNVEDIKEEEGEEEAELDDLTPPFPILQMSLDHQLIAYFSKLMKRLANLLVRKRQI